MIARRILAAGALGACAFLMLAGQARADSMTPTCQLLSSGGGVSCPTPDPQANPPVPPVFAVPGQHGYEDSFSGGTANGAITGSDINGSSVGFIDDYWFQISPASADTVSTTISDTDFAVSNLFARLYSLSANPGGLVLAQPAGVVYDGVVTEIGPVTEVQIDPVTLAAGSYVLEISGTASGPDGGGYSGRLNLSPAPLPASLPLLLTGLLGFVGLRPTRARSF